MTTTQPERAPVALPGVPILYFATVSERQKGMFADDDDDWVERLSPTMRRLHSHLMMELNRREASYQRTGIGLPVRNRQLTYRLLAIWKGEVHINKKTGAIDHVDKDRLESWVGELTTKLRRHGDIRWSWIDDGRTTNALPFYIANRRGYCVARWRRVPTAARVHAGESREPMCTLLFATTAEIQNSPTDWSSVRARSRSSFAESMGSSRTTW
jgi:hypothetical protein